MKKQKNDPLQSALTDLQSLDLDKDSFILMVVKGTDVHVVTHITELGHAIGIVKELNGNAQTIKDHMKDHLMEEVREEI